jgi:hypothetical protein
MGFESNQWEILRKKLDMLLVPLLNRQEKELFYKSARNLKQPFPEWDEIAINFDLRIFIAVFKPFQKFALFKWCMSSVCTAQKTHNSCNTYTNQSILFTISNNNCVKHKNKYPVSTKCRVIEYKCMLRTQ